MNILSLLLMATAVSIDGFWGGFAFGLKRTRIPLTSLIIIGGWSVICSMAAMLIGYFLTDHIPAALAKTIGALLLFIIGLITLKEGIHKKNEYNGDIHEDAKVSLKDIFKIIRNPLLADVDNQNDIKPSEATLLGLAVAMDASIAAFTVALSGCSPFTTPFLFGFTHFVMIGIGNILATRKFFDIIGARMTLVPGFILILLGLARLI